MKVGKDMELQQKKAHLYIKMRHIDDIRKKSVRSQLKKGLKKYKRHNLVGRWMLKVLFVDLES